ASRRSMGALPTPGRWVRLAVPVSQVGLAGHMLNGMAFTLYGGLARWDAARKRSTHNEHYRYDDKRQRLKRPSNRAQSYAIHPGYEIDQVLCQGQTAASSTSWQQDGNTIYVDVDTSSCGLDTTPLYISALNGDSGHWVTTGGNAIYYPTNKGFRIYLR